MAKKAAAQQSTAIVKWDEELAAQADVAASMASSAGSQFFSVKNGVLSWNDAPVPNNQMAVIILGAIHENVYYEGKYDANNPEGPKCFAFSKDISTKDCAPEKMAPHEVAVKAETAQEGPCASCPMNEWGSSDTGKGKACRNTRRLAMIPAGTLNAQGKFEPIDDADEVLTTKVGNLKLPVTSVKGFDGFVKQVAGALRRPPHGIITKVKVVPDAKNQFKVTFEPIDNVPNELMGAVMKRREEVLTLIDAPYTPYEEQEPPQKKAPARGKRKY